MTKRKSEQPRVFDIGPAVAEIKRSLTYKKPEPFLVRGPSDQWIAKQVFNLAEKKWQRKFLADTAHGGRVVFRLPTRRGGWTDRQIEALADV